MAVDLSEYAEPEQGAAGADLSEYAVPEEQTGIPRFDMSSIAQPQVRSRPPGYSPGELAGKASSAISNAVTGADRREFDLPEFTLPTEFSMRNVKADVGRMTTFNPVREMNILKTNYPDLKFAKDSFGNIIADGTAYGAGVGYVNRPGLSWQDIAKAGFQLAAFTPAGRAGGLATGTAGRMTGVGAAAAGTELGLDVLGQYTGATEDVSLGNVNYGNVAAAGLGGGVFEGLGRVIAPLLPKWRQSGRQVTDEIRAAFRAAAAEMGRSPDNISDDLISGYMQAAERSIDTQSMPAHADTVRFGVPYTRGQMSGETKQLQLEDRLRNGPSGRAAGTMERFGQEQNEAIMQVRAAEQGALAQGQPLISAPVEAGEAAIEGARARAARDYDAIDTAYEEVGQASLLPQGQRALFTRLRRVAKVQAFETTSDLAPGTRVTLDQIDTIQDMLAESGNLLRPLHMRRLETFRKQLNKRIGAAPNPTDKSQLVTFKRELDTYLDKAIDRALFIGDQDALSALKRARGLHAEYMQRFSQQDVKTRSGRTIRDEAGALVERIVEGNPTSEEVVNFVFGVTKLGGRKQGARTAERLRGILGEDSAEWSAIRQAAFLRLTDPGKASVISGEKFLTNLTYAQSNAPTLVGVLFSPAEWARMNDFARAVIRAQPSVAKYGNVSRSGHKMAEYVGDAWQKMVVALGFSQGGLAGGAAAAAAGNIPRTVSGLRAQMQAVQATTAGQAPLARIPMAGAIGAPAAVQGLGQ